MDADLIALAIAYVVFVKALHKLRRCGACCCWVHSILRKKCQWREYHRLAPGWCTVTYKDLS